MHRPVKTWLIYLNALLWALVFISFYGCDASQLTQPEAPAARSVAVGDNVVALESSTVYKKPDLTQPVGDINAGASGTVTRGPSQFGTWRVDWATTSEGWVSPDVIGEGDVVPPPPPPPPPPVGMGPIMAAGCSIMRDGVNGYNQIAPVGEQLYPINMAVNSYSGSKYSLDGYSDPTGKAILKLQSNAQTYGASAVHWMICVHGPSSGKKKARSENVPWPVDDEIQQARSAIANMKSAVPGVPIFVSAYPGYTVADPASPEFCSLTDTESHAAMDSLASIMEAEGLAIRGPKFQPFEPSHLDNRLGGAVDYCHPDESEGEPYLGNQMRDWALTIINP